MVDSNSKKHKIQPSRFNNYENFFEMGSKITLDNRIITLENALFIIRNESTSYTIIKSPLAYHDLDNKTIKGIDGTMDKYYFKSEEIKSHITHYLLNTFIYHLGNNKPKFEAKEIEATIYYPTKKTAVLRPFRTINCNL